LKKVSEMFGELKKAPYLCNPFEKRTYSNKTKFIENNRKTSSIVLENYDFNTRY